jgi:hypothetical protein
MEKVRFRLLAGAVLVVVGFYLARAVWPGPAAFVTQGLLAVGPVVGGALLVAWALRDWARKKG